MGGKTKVTDWKSFQVMVQLPPLKQGSVRQLLSDTTPWRTWPVRSTVPSESGNSLRLGTSSGNISTILVMLPLLI
jgi:hypothetical protein